MTIIKQRAVTERGHQRNLRAYINDDKKVLLRDSQNMEDCKNLNRWATFMEETRKAFGHDKAARRVRDKKTGELVQAKNTIMYHQILAFLPDECDINGGKLTPEDCMRYAKVPPVCAYSTRMSLRLALDTGSTDSNGSSNTRIHGL